MNWRDKLIEKRRAVGLVSVLVGLLAGVTSSVAVEEGDLVVVIYNTRVPESKMIAEHYAERRKVPAAQVFGFELPKSDAMSRAEYRNGLEQPLLKKLAALKLWRFGPGEIVITNGQPTKTVDKVIESKIRSFPLH